jgi:misacylated tRNA(Ala) deacylase
VQPFSQSNPDTFELEAEAIDARPGAVLLAQSPIFPGGGGQLPDRGMLRSDKGQASVHRITPDERGWWHEFESDDEIAGVVCVSIDASFRRLMCELHTLAHVTNSIVFQDFGGALLTGAQLSEDGTFRVDFDLPSANTDRPRTLAGPINDAIRQDFPIRTFHMPWEEANAIPGLFRNKSISRPRQADGNVRIVEIVGLDRQGCGGTRLASTAQSRSVRILKIDNKGRQNRRVKVGFAEQ